MKKHNFSAGPCILPQEVIIKASEAVMDFNNSGLSLIEISHRSKEFVDVMEQARSLAIELLGLEGKGYKALFLQGGASTQFLMVALNLLEKRAGYLNTGTWSDKAIKEAKIYDDIYEVASSKSGNYNYIPKGFDIPEEYDYFHCTSNNTIFGTQIKEFPDCPIPMVCDMSSDIFSRQLDFSKFDIIYAGAQKNMGPAGTTLVVIKEDVLGKVSRHIPSMMDYKIHMNKGSMFNTPPVFPIYAMYQNLKWVKASGGVAEMERRAQNKAALLYNEIDSNPKFEGTAKKEDRSHMNACFKLVDETKNEAFMEAATQAGCSGIKGHRSVGGFRASMYNALPLESVQVLVDVMKKF